MYQSVHYGDTLANDARQGAKNGSTIIPSTLALILFFSNIFNIPFHFSNKYPLLIHHRRGISIFNVNY